jgi:hypothetical protein
MTQSPKAALYTPKVTLKLEWGKIEGTQNNPFAI